MTSDLIARFLSYLRSERGMSENTLESYETDLSKFAESFRRPLNEASRTDLQEYIANVLASGKSGSTAARYLACLRTFYRFLVDECEITHDPTRNLPAPKTWHRVPKSLGEADLETMVNSLGSAAIDKRDRAILLVFFGSGLRESELADLKLQDVNLEAGVVKVWNGKGGRDGVLPLSQRATEALETYLQDVRPVFSAYSSEPCLFVGRTGNQLTRQAIFVRVRKIANGALGKKVSPHQLRHGFATALVEGGADIRDVQVLMRHSSVETTRIYVHMDLTFLRRTYNASHPRARFLAA